MSVLAIRKVVLYGDTEHGLGKEKLMTPKCLPVGAAVIALQLFSAIVCAQDKESLPLVRSYFEFGRKRAFLWIHQLDDQRVTATLANVQGVGDEDTIELTEGYYLGFYYAPDGKSGAKRLECVMRVQVAEIEPNRSVRLVVGPDAIKRLRPNASLNLCRPVQSATQELRTVPDVMELTLADEAALEKLLSLRRSVNDLKQISLAMQNFHDVYGHYPPAVVYGPDGKPWHSWRVLLLPFLDERQLYDRYDFSQPWNGARNIHIANAAPDVYRDDVYDNADPGATHYVAITGKGTAFPKEGAKLAADLKLNLSKTPGMTARDDFKDGLEATLLVGPAPSAAKIPWTKPEDLVLRDGFPAPGAPGSFGMPYEFGERRTGAFLLATDTIDKITVATLTQAVEPRMFRGLLTIAGGESVDTRKLPQIGTLPSRPRDSHVVLEVSRTSSGGAGRLFVKKQSPPPNQ